MNRAPWKQWGYSTMWDLMSSLLSEERLERIRETQCMRQTGRADRTWHAYNEKIAESEPKSVVLVGDEDNTGYVIASVEAQEPKLGDNHGNR